MLQLGGLLPQLTDALVAATWQHSKVARASELKDSQFNAHLCQISIVVSLSKKLYSHCYSLPSC